ncbi:MAG: hypothetical protein RI601_11105 [Desulfurivibrionaceae bacterium]|nr:hypothetical protein [Desulfurivibrionaceae bacterium]
MTPLPDHNFQPLIAAHDFTSSKLLSFFDGNDFAEAEFSVNEFDVFALFFVTMAFLSNKEPTKDLGVVVEDFHATIIGDLVQRILSSQDKEATRNKEEALAAMIKKIFEERFRHYFHIFKKSSPPDRQQIYTSLAEAFLEKSVQGALPQETLSRFTSFLRGLFDEVVAFLEKTESLAGCRPEGAGDIK